MRVMRGAAADDVVLHPLMMFRTQSRMALVGATPPPRLRLRCCQRTVRVPRADDRCLSNLATMRDGLDRQGLRRKAQVHEAILVILPGDVRFLLACDATTPSANDVGGVPQEVAVFPGTVQLLVVRMAGDDQVNAERPHEGDPEFLAPTRREVRDDNLPVSCRLGHLAVNPSLLAGPEVLEPVWAILHRPRPLRSTRCILGIVLARAQVVPDEVSRLEGIVDIAVQEVIVHRKAWVQDFGLPILRRSHPSARAGLFLCPRIADGLVPTVGEHEPAVIVVA
mmetsp:Transcript_65760/g.165767  ORF Transcript_65760/g.165767 Transcript_65760/m.165767 type:complete len:280 (+) Transcript_65760:812-1651(+)